MLNIYNFDQGSPEWHAARCGLLTASEVKLILTPTLKRANNDKTRSHTYELLAQRITGYVEPHYISDDMLRGHDDELRARELYRAHYATVDQAGFITRTFPSGLIIGYSPDGLVGEDGQIECKSRRQKYQIQTVLEATDPASGTDTIPDDYTLQVQTGLLVTGRQWCDFVSYSGGLPMVVIRVIADQTIQSAILEAAEVLDLTIASLMRRYHSSVEQHGWHATERAPTEFEITGADE